MKTKLRKEYSLSEIKTEKLQLDKLVRLRLLIFIVGILVFSTAFLLNSLLQRKTIEQTVKKVLGNHEGIISYNVILEPNPIYSNGAQDMDEMYITEMVDNIHTNYEYKYKGNTDGEISVEYSINAVIEAFNQNEKNEILWSKNYPLQPKIKKTGMRNITLNDSININFNEYNSFVRDFFDKYKIISKVNLLINYNISVEVRDKGKIISRDTLSPKLVIPMSEDYFKISGNRKESKEIKVENTKTVVVKNSNRIIFFSLIDGIFILLLIILLAFVTSSDKSHQNKKIQGILRKYNSRIVQIYDERYFSIDNGIYVRSFDDLLKASDELGKPILYNSLNSTVSENFFILGEENNYICKIDGK